MTTAAGGWRPKWWAGMNVTCMLGFFAYIMMPPHVHAWLAADPTRLWLFRGGFLTLLLVIGAVGLWKQRRWDAGLQE